MKMECPHLSDGSDEKICSLMTKQGIDGELDDFDTTHYCKSKPNHCFFYRLCKVHEPTREQLKDGEPEKIQVVFFDELSKHKLGEAEISVDHDDAHPLYLKLVKRGFRYRVKPDLVDKWVVTTMKEK